MICAEYQYQYLFQLRSHKETPGTNKTIKKLTKKMICTSCLVLFIICNLVTCYTGSIFLFNYEHH